MKGASVRAEEIRGWWGAALKVFRKLWVKVVSEGGSGVPDSDPPPELRDLLVAGVAHDINNLLLPVLALAERIGEDPAASETTRDRARLILEAAGRSAALAAKLLAYTGRKPKAQPVDVGPLARDVQRLLRAVAGPALEVRLERAQTPLWVEADSEELLRALWNLALNAAEATGGSGRVLIGVRRVRENGENGIEVYVTDTGPSGTRSVRGRHTLPGLPRSGHFGLGHMVARQVAESHRGSFRFEKFRGGAVARLRLPESPPPRALCGQSPPRDRRVCRADLDESKSEPLSAFLRVQIDALRGLVRAVETAAQGEPITVKSVSSEE